MAVATVCARPCVGPEGTEAVGKNSGIRSRSRGPPSPHRVASGPWTLGGWVEPRSQAARTLKPQAQALALLQGSADSVYPLVLSPVLSRQPEQSGHPDQGGVSFPLPSLPPHKEQGSRKARLGVGRTGERVLFGTQELLKAGLFVPAAPAVPAQQQRPEPAVPLRAGLVRADGSGASRQPARPNRP